VLLDGASGFRRMRSAGGEGVAGTWRALLLTLVRAEFGIWAPTAMVNRIQVFRSCTICHA